MVGSDFPFFQTEHDTCYNGFNDQFLRWNGRTDPREFHSDLECGRVPEFVFIRSGFVIQSAYFILAFFSIFSNTQDSSNRVSNSISPSTPYGGQTVDECLFDSNVTWKMMCFASTSEWAYLNSSDDDVERAVDNEDEVVFIAITVCRTRPPPRDHVSTESRPACRRTRNDRTDEGVTATDGVRWNFIRCKHC